jgi:hypothetical protein
MNHELEHPITEEELRLAILEMDVGKAPRPNGVAIKIFIKFWSIVGVNCHKMVVEVITVGKFYEGITKGLITFLHKGRRALQLKAHYSFQCVLQDLHKNVIKKVTRYFYGSD